MSSTQEPGGPEIVPSILSADFSRLGAQIEELKQAGCRMLHIDVMDGHFVPNITIGLPVVQSLRQATDLRLDCHLMIENPDRYAGRFAEAGADMVSVHQEAAPHLDRTLAAIRAAGAKAGVALNPATPVSTVAEMLDRLDFVLVMSVNPGFSGQSFIPQALNKVSQLAELRASTGEDFLIEIDGGVGPGNIEPVARAGANLVVAASAIFGASNPAESFGELQRAAALAIGALLLLSLGCRRHKHQDLDLAESAEPDKILYEKSVEDIQNHRYTVARLTLQTLINTYPESVYLADAKLAVADSYYEEGTTSSLAHAEIEYKDYITFFPNSPEASRAQYRAAMTHYRQLELPDRDQSHGFRAETEFQTLLKKFPNSEYTEEGVNRLLEVQEVLAEGEYLVGRFYFIRKFSQRATISRLEALVERYPNFSQRDEALWMLANTWGTPRKENRWGGNQELAGDYYTRIVREHPISPLYAAARRRLERMELPVPEPDPLILERAKTLKTVGGKSERPGLLKRMFGRFSGRPDTSAAAARLGPPPLEPPDNLNNLPFRQMRSGNLERRNTITVDGASSGNP